MVVSLAALYCHYPKSSFADFDVVQRCMLPSIVGWRRFDNEEWANTVKRMNAAGGSGLGPWTGRKGCRGSWTPCPRTGGPASAHSFSERQAGKCKCRQTEKADTGKIRRSCRQSSGGCYGQSARAARSGRGRGPLGPGSWGSRPSPLA